MFETLLNRDKNNNKTFMLRIVTAVLFFKADMT
jgi:hypothetical protein